jgi:hypothetical protein
MTAAAGIEITTGGHSALGPGQGLAKMPAGVFAKDMAATSVPSTSGTGAASFRTGWQSLLASMSGGTALDAANDGPSEDQALASTAGQLSGSNASLPTASALTATIPFLTETPVAGQAGASASGNTATAAKLAQTTSSTATDLQQNAAFLAGLNSTNATVTRASVSATADSSRESNSSHSTKESKRQTSSSESANSGATAVAVQVLPSSTAIVQPVVHPAPADPGSSSTASSNLVASESTTNAFALSGFASVAGDYSLPSAGSRSSGTRQAQTDPRSSVAAVSSAVSENPAEAFKDRTTSSSQGNAQDEMGDGLGSSNEQFFGSSPLAASTLTGEQSQTVEQIQRTDKSAPANVAAPSAATVTSADATSTQPLSAAQWSTLQSNAAQSGPTGVSTRPSSGAVSLSSDTSGLYRSQVDETAPRALMNKLPFASDPSDSSPSGKETVSTPESLANESKAPELESRSGAVSSQVAASYNQLQNVATASQNLSNQNAAVSYTPRQNAATASQDLTGKDAATSDTQKQNAMAPPQETSNQNAAVSYNQRQDATAAPQDPTSRNAAAASMQEQNPADEAQGAATSSVLQADSNAASTGTSSNQPAIPAKSSPIASGSGVRRFNFSAGRAVPQALSGSAPSLTAAAATNADSQRTRIQNSSPSPDQSRNEGQTQSSSQATVTKADRGTAGSATQPPSSGAEEAGSSTSAKPLPQTATMTAFAGSSVASTVSSADAAAAEDAASTRSGRVVKQNTSGTTHGAAAATDGSATPSAQMSSGTFPVQGASQAHDLSAARGATANSLHGASGNTSGDAESTTSKTFAALDAEPTTTAPSWIRAGAQQAEAGYKDPELGWVGVRADASGGVVHASLVPGSADASATLGGHLDGLNAYMAERHTPVEAITMAAPESRSAGLDMNQSSHQQMSQGNGQGADESQQTALNMGSNSGQGAEQGAPAEQYFTPQTTAPAAVTARSPVSDGNTSATQTVEAAGSNGTHISVVA